MHVLKPNLRKSTQKFKDIFSHHKSINTHSNDVRYKTNTKKYKEENI